MSHPTEPLAIEGGRPVRMHPLPYGRQSVDEDDIASVVAALRSDWLTTGPRVEEFETSFARSVGARHGVAVSSGTAALHAAYHALGLGPGDEVIATPLTFAATTNAVLYCGARPVFADVEPDTLLLDPATVEARLTPRTKAIVGVDYAGQPCDWDALSAIARPRGVALVADACHAVGGGYHGRPVGSLADLTVFSFHPVKQMTTGEGGMITASEDKLAIRARIFRNHGITTDHRQREKLGSYHYDMVELGFNYRLTDIQCALGMSQLAKLGGFVKRRQALAARYDRAISPMAGVRPLVTRAHASHAYHLYVVRLDLARLTCSRAQVHAALRAEGVHANVHYRPVHLHPYYRRALGTGPGLAPVAEAASEDILSLPLFPAMSESDVDDVVRALEKVLARFAR